MGMNTTIRGFEIFKVCKKLPLIFFTILFLAGNSFAQGPLISYTPLTNPCNSNARVLTVNIDDADGIPVTGLNTPILYFRVSSGPYNAIAGVKLSGNNWSFTFGAGYMPGQIISYFVVAADLLGNTSVFPSAGASATVLPLQINTPPTTPDFYIIQNPLAPGTYRVGVAGPPTTDFITITDAVNAYNNSCLSGPVTFLLMDFNTTATGTGTGPIYGPNEVFPITIHNPLASATNTLTIKPFDTIAGPSMKRFAVIKGNSDEAIFKFNAADYVTISGKKNLGTADPNIPYLYAYNTSENPQSTVMWVANNASDPATNNKIQYCGLIGNGADKTFGGIISSSGNGAGQISEVANSFNSYTNNIINSSLYGIGVFGAPSNELSTNISNNTIGSTTVLSKLGYRGISLLNQKDMVVENNTVSGILASQSFAEPTCGIAVYGNSINGKINRNKVSDIKNVTEPISQAVYGIGVYTETVNSGLRIQNNFVFNLQSYGNATIPANNAHGIAILGGTGYKIYHNSVLWNNAQTISSGGLISCLFLGENVSTSTSVDVRNNIFSMQGTKGLRYSVYVGSSSPVIFSAIDYNDYFSKQFTGYLGGGRNTLAEWQESTGSDANSLAIDPLFVSTSDIHLKNNSPLDSRGVGGLSVTVDFDNDARPGVKPDIGADEITPAPCNDNQGGLIVSNRKDVCFTGDAILSASGFSTGGGIEYQWQSSSDGATYTSIAGAINPLIFNTAVINTDTYYRLKVTCSAGTPGYSNVILMPVLKPAVASFSNNVSRCGAGTVTLTASGAPASGSPLIKWYDVPTNGAPLATSNSLVTPYITSSSTFYAEAQMGGSSGTVGPTKPSSVSTSMIVTPSSFKLFFDVLAPTTLVSVDMFPGLIGERAEIAVFNKAGTKLISVPFNTTVQGSTTPQTIFINIQLPVGQDYYLVDGSSTPPRFPNGGFYMNTSGANYPYNSSDVRITGNDYSPAFYINYFNIKFSSACASPRKVVPVTINPPPSLDITATQDSVCAGSQTTLKVTSPNTNYIYKWQPGNMVGNSVNVSPLTTTTYTLNATDAVCGNSGSIKINIKAMPETVFTNAGQTKCYSEPAIKLDATGGVVRGEIILFEDFNGTSGTRPPNWIANSGATFKYLTPGSSLYNTVTNSNDGSQFFGVDGNISSAINSLSRSPKLNFSAFNNINMTFNYIYSGYTTDIFDVQVSTATTPGTTFTASDWVTVWSGGIRYMPFKKATVDLSAYAHAPNVYIRFRYKTQDGFFAAIDDLLITGNDLAPSFTWSPVAGLFTDAAGTIPYTGGASPTVYASPEETQIYEVASTGMGGCANRAQTQIKVRETGGEISGDNIICGGGSTNLTVKLTGTKPWSITYTDGITPVTINNILDSIFTFPVTPTVAAVYTLTAVTDLNCGARPSKITGSATINFTSPGISSWVGTNNNWFDQANWCGFVPDAGTKVIIPTGAIAYPVIDGIAATKEISIATNANLTIGASGSLSVKETFANNGTLKNNGTILLDGNALQVFPTGSGTITAMNVLDLNNTVGVTLNKKMRISGKLKPRAGTITLVDTIFISSTLDSTASITKAGATTQFVYSGIGKFTVERFIPDHRKAWQLLSAGTFGQSVREAWMEGATFPLQNIKPGYGTITTSNLPNALVQGFDFYTPLGSTVKIYNPNTNEYDGIESTSTSPVSQPNGYLIYVRGDRSVTDAATPANNVILRSSGKIYSPTNPPANITAGALKFTSVGNPYACAIDFANVLSTSTGIDTKFYVWDPVLTGSSGNGGYQTISSTNGYKPVPGSSKYPSNIPVTNIESGQAIIIYSTSGGTVKFSENNKVEGSVMRFRPEGNSSRSYLRASLNYNNILMDGNVIAFDDNFTNGFDKDDAKKLANTAQGFGIKSNAQIFAVEARKPVIATDTVFYSMSNMRQGNYQFVFVPENLDASLTAWLIDSYTQAPYELSNSGTTNYSFSVNGAAGSSAANRFYVIFKMQRPLPVTILNVNAIKQDNFVRVEWKVNDEINIDRYEVLRSADGINFTSIGTTNALANSGIINYDLLDMSPLIGDNYYRIKSIGIGGDIKLSSIVRVNFSIPYVIKVYPNPVVNNYFNVQFSGLPAGSLKLQLFNSAGQLVWKTNYENDGNPANIRVNPSMFIAAGIYSLIIEGDRVREVRSVSFGRN